MSKAREILSVHLPTAVWAAWTAYLLVSPDERLPASYPEFPPNTWVNWGNLFEWASHLVLSYVLCTLLSRSLTAVRPRTSSLFATAGAVATYGALLEALQTFVPGRSPALSDIAANLIGIGLWIVWARRHPRTDSTPAG